MPVNAKGFVPVMLTLFKEDGTIDFDGLTRLTAFYLGSGAKGLFANCLSSEMYELDDAEKLQVIAHVVKAANGRVPVVATGNFGHTLREQAAFIKQVYALGVQAVILLTNQLVKQNEPESVLETNVLRLLDLTGTIPLGFYECPEPYKIVLSADLLSRFVNTGRIIYHKDTCMDIEQVRGKNRQTAGHRRFGLYDAHMEYAVMSLKAGSAGLSCIQGNYFPALVAWLCENYNNAGLQKEVQLVQQFFVDEMEVMHKNYPKAAKYYLWKSGMDISVFTRASGNNHVSYELKDDIDRLGARYDHLLRQISVIFNKAE